MADEHGIQRQTSADRVMKLVWRTPPSDLPEQTRRRVIVYLIPYLFCLYILAYIDRVNVSVAKLGMQKAPSELGLAFDAKIVGFGAGVFFWGYWILEMPSTLSVLRWGARYVFVRILVLWGLSCVLIGFIGLPWMNEMLGWLASPAADTTFVGVGWIANNIFRVDPGDLTPLVVREFHFLRFLLGLFEGGFFPSVILYLSLWFRGRDRGRAIATFMSAIPVSSMIGSPLSGAMLHLDWFGMPGWRWVFILQGAVPIVAGVVTLFFLPNRPADATWLKGDEKEWLVQELASEQQSRKIHGHFGWLGQAWVVLLMTVYYFCMNVTSYGLSMFMPSIIKAQSGVSDSWAAVLAGLPYVMGLVGMLVNGWHSDRTQERIGHVAVPLVCLSLGLFLAGYCNDVGPIAVVIMVVGVGTFMYAHLPAFWPIPTIFMGAAAAASAIGFINMMGNLGGFVGPTLFAEAADKKEYARGLHTLAPFPLVSVAIILFIGYLRRDRLRASRV